MTIDTACSASLAALDVVIKYIQVGDINAAIVAGVHLWLRSVIKYHKKEVLVDRFQS